jgi:hypothetical protein
MSSTEHDPRWPHIAELLARSDGQIMLGHVAPIEGAAVATAEQTLFAALVRREGESINALLQRLGEAIGAALHHGVLTNEINGGNLRLAPARTRKKR